MSESREGEYRAITDWPYAISSGGVVYELRGGVPYILTLYREAPDGRHYHLPKGGLSINETLESCAIREIEEETGAKVTLRGYLGTLADEYFDPKRQIWNEKTVHFFAAEFEQFAQEPDDEHDGHEFLPLKIASQKLAETEPLIREHIIVDRLEKFLELKNRQSWPEM